MQVTYPLTPQSQLDKEMKAMTVQSEGSPLTGKEYYHLHPALTKTLQSFDIGGPPLSTEFYLNFVGFHFFIFSLLISLISPELESILKLFVSFYVKRDIIAKGKGSCTIYTFISITGV